MVDIRTLGAVLMLAGFDRAYGTPYWTSRGFPMGRLGRFGLGDFCDDNPAECGQAPNDPNLLTSDGGYYNPTQVFGTNLSLPSSGSSGSSFNWGGMLNTVATDFSTIFKAIQPVPAGCTQVAGPYGTSVSCAAPGQAASPLSFSSGSMGGSLVPWLIGGVVVFVAAKALGGKS